MQEAKIGGIRETRPENSIIDHGEIQRRHEQLLSISHAIISYIRRIIRRLQRRDLDRLADPSLKSFDSHVSFAPKFLNDRKKRKEKRDLWGEKKGILKSESKERIYEGSYLMIHESLVVLCPFYTV